jgi:integrase
MQSATRSRRVRVERGIYLQPNNKYAVCCRRAGKLRFRTVEGDLAEERVLGREEIERLLASCSGQYRLIVATALYTGLRISELLGLIWDDVDFAAGVIRVRAQLSRAHRGAPATRVPPKTAASNRDVPLVAQLAGLLIAHRQTTQFAAGTDWVFATSRGTPHGQRNITGAACSGPRRWRSFGAMAGRRCAFTTYGTRSPAISSWTWDSTLPRSAASRTCERHDHTRCLHPPLRRRTPRPGDTHPHDESPFAELLAPASTAGEGRSGHPR